MPRVGLNRIGRRAVIAGLALLPVLPTVAAAAVTPPLAEALRGLGLDPEAVRWSSAVTLTAPAIADDGAVVPVAVAVADPVAVRALHLFAPANRRAHLVTFSPLSDLLVPDWRLRVRLAQGQTLAAVAVLADGRRVGAMAEVGVAAGSGCRS